MRMRSAALLSLLPILAGSVPGATAPARPAKPNVLLVTIDTLRADRLAIYGRTGSLTPSLDGLAAKAAVFLNAFAHTPMTLPSHANILLGTTPLVHGVHDNMSFVVAEEWTTLAEHLKARGYATAAFVAAYPLDRRFGLAQGFDLYDDDFGHQDFSDRTFVERRAGPVIDRACRWIGGRRSAWFAWVHLFDPHAPYDPPAPYRERYGRQPYDGEVAYADAELGRLFKFLVDEKAMDSTVVLVTADHGESLGEHGEKTHGFFAYNSALWVPLIILRPGERPLRLTNAVSHIDIFPTLCEVLGIPAPAGLQGASLLPLLEGQRSVDREVYIESLYPFYSRGWAPLRGLITNGRKYLECPIPELYDLKQDFDEIRNLAPGQPVEALRRKLREYIESHTPEAAAGPPTKPDPELVKKMRSLGYVMGPAGEAPRPRTFTARDDVKTLLPLHSRAEEAMELLQKGQADAARGILEGLLRERDDLDVVYTSLAQVHKSQARLDRALKVLKSGGQRILYSYDIYIATVTTLLDLGRNDEVVALVTGRRPPQAELDPELWNSLGVAYSRQGRIAEARDAFVRALALDKDFPRALNNLGTMHLLLFFKNKDERDYGRALESFQSCLKIDPGSAQAHNGLGALYKASGDLDRAIAHWEKAVRLAPDFGNALYNLGLAYLEKGNKPRALEYFLKYRESQKSRLSPAELREIEALIQKSRSA